MIKQRGLFGARVAEQLGLTAPQRTGSQEQRETSAQLRPCWQGRTWAGRAELVTKSTDSAREGTATTQIRGPLREWRTESGLEKSLQCRSWVPPGDELTAARTQSPPRRQRQRREHKRTHVQPTSGTETPGWHLCRSSRHGGPCWGCGEPLMPAGAPKAQTACCCREGVTLKERECAGTWQCCLLHIRVIRSCS